MAKSRDTEFMNTTADEQLHPDQAQTDRAQSEKQQQKQQESISDGDRAFTSDGEELRAPSKLKIYLASLLSGNILSRSEVRRMYPYMLFIAFLMLLYISNVFKMQQMYRREAALKREIKELRAKSVTISSMKMNATRQSQIIKELRERGIDLQESLTPHKLIE